VVPFAVHDGREWVKAWPEPGEGLQTDGMLENVRSYWRERRQRPPQEWRLAGAAPGTRPLRVLEAVAFDDHCLRQIGFLTTHRESGSRPDAHFRRMVVSGPASVFQPSNIARNAAARQKWAGLVEAARNAFISSETSAVKDWAEGSGRRFPLTATALAARPIRFTAMYVHEEGRARTLYFEGERNYGAPLHRPDARCHGRTRVNGWITAGPDTRPVTSGVSAAVDDCDEKTSARLLPLGITTINGRTYWLVSEHYYEGESRFVIEAGRDGVRRVLEAPGGGC
jgi:hypothetical protein